MEDPVVVLCQDWIRLDKEHDALTRRWQELETHLVRARNWFKLSDAERQLVPEAVEMRAISKNLGALFASRSDLFTRLPQMKAASLQGVCAKLKVAAASIFPDENPEAHALLQNTLMDLQTLLETGAHLPE